MSNTRINYPRKLRALVDAKRGDTAVTAVQISAVHSFVRDPMSILSGNFYIASPAAKAEETQANMDLGEIRLEPYANVIGVTVVDLFNNILARYTGIDSSQYPEFSCISLTPDARALYALTPEHSKHVIPGSMPVLIEHTKGSEEEDINMRLKEGGEEFRKKLERKRVKGPETTHKKQ